MLGNFDILYTQIQPYRFLSDLRVDIQKIGDFFYAFNTETNSHSLLITNNEIISTDILDHFVGGNILDFHYYFVTKDYKKSLAFFLSKYKDQLKTAGIQDDYYIQQASKELLQQRSLLEELYGLYKNNANLMEFHREITFLRKYHIDPQNIKNILFYATKEQVESMLFNAFNCVELPVELKGTHYIVLPFYKTHGKIAYLKLLNIRTNEREIIKVQGTKFSFLNYRKIQPQKEQEINLFLKDFDALYFQSFSTSSSYFDKVGISVHYDPTESESTLVIENILYNYKLNDDISIINQLNPNETKLKVSTKQVGNLIKNTISWETFVCDKIILLIREDKGVSYRVLGFVNQITYEGKLKEYIETALVNAGMGHLIAALHKESNTQMVFSFGNFEIVEREFGYEMRKKGETNSKPLTNFIIQFDKTIIFTSTNEVFYKGTLNVANSYKAPFFISQKDMQNGHNLKLILTQSVRDYVKDLRQLPIFLDSSMISRLIDVFTRKLADTKLEIGVDTLGWSTNKDSFITPFWKVTSIGITEGKVIPHPRIDFFNYFNFEKKYSWELITQPEAKLLDKLVADVISVSVSYLIRSYLGYPVPVTIMKENINAKNLLRYIFSSFGQNQGILNLPQNKRKKESELLPQFNGLPIYGTCPNYTKFIEDNVLPIFMFVPTYGLEVTQAFTKEEYSQIAYLSCTIFKQTVQSLLNGAAFNHFDHISTDSEISTLELIQEGASFIKEILNIKDWNVTNKEDMSFLHFLMITPNIITHLKLSVEEQWIIICYKDLKINRKSLLNLVKQFDNNAKIIEPFYITLNVELFKKYIEGRLTLDLSSLQPFVRRTKEEESTTNVIEMV